MDSLQLDLGVLLRCSWVTVRLSICQAASADDPSRAGLSSAPEWEARRLTDRATGTEGTQNLASLGASPEA